MKTSPRIALALFFAACTLAQARQLPADPVVDPAALFETGISDSATVADLLNALTQVKNAQEMLSNKQYAEARTTLEALVRLHPEFADAVLPLAQASMYLGYKTAGEAYFVRYHRLMEKRPHYRPGEMLLVLARLARERDDAPAALGWLDKIDPSDKKHFFSAQVQRALLLVKQGDLEGARLLLSSYKPDDPDMRAELLLVEVELVREAGQTEEAFALLAQGAPRYPTNAELQYAYASVANKTGRFEIAEAAMRAFIALRPDMFEGPNNLGFWFAERNVKLPEALELLTRALALAPDHPNVLGSMGWVQYRLGKLAEAEGYLRRAHAAEPDAENAVYLAEVIWQRGQKDAARALLRDASAREPQNAVLRKTLARLQITL